MPSIIPHPLTPRSCPLTPDTCPQTLDSWDRQPGELNLWYARFERYRLAGPNRSLLGTLNDERVRRGKKKGRSLPQSWATNVKRWRWQDRASAWDEYERRQARVRHAQAIEEANRRHIQHALALQNKASQRLQAMEPGGLSPMVVLRYIVEGAKLERAALGQPQPTEEQPCVRLVNFGLDDDLAEEEETELEEQSSTAARPCPIDEATADHSRSLPFAPIRSAAIALDPRTDHRVPVGLSLKEAMQMPKASEKLRRQDYLLLTLVSMILFGYSVISMRPLTVHEARLPQTARAMRATGQWLFPQSGARPWLERPPLPHWIVNAVMAVAGHHDLVLVERLPSAVMGTIVVLLTAWTAAGLFGRTTGLVSGLVLATSWQLYMYASLAEDDIYLAAVVAACMALFVRAEFVDQRTAEDRRTNPFSTRPLVVLAFFGLLGLSNAIKSPLFGMLVVLPAIGCYLLWRWDGRRMLRYVWVWGWLVCLAIGAAWPLAAYYAYPDVMDNWAYDYLGRVSGNYAKINQPAWYYGPAILVALMPWTPFALFGLALTGAAAWRKQDSPERLLWCWAIAPLVVLSVPQGKHHHYLVPVIAPWAILGAIGLMRVAETVARKYPRFNPRWAMGLAVALLFVGYSLGQTFAAPATDRTVQDTKFLRQTATLIPSGKLLFINADEDESLDFFRLQFYSRNDAKLLQNLTYLREEGIDEPVVYVIARTRDQSKLETMGTAKILIQSEKSHGDGTPGGRFALFELCFDANLQRYPTPPRPTCLQAMGREPGPFCGPQWRTGLRQRPEAPSGGSRAKPTVLPLM